jgi:hypothetical protein
MVSTNPTREPRDEAFLTEFEECLKRHFKIALPKEGTLLGGQV